MTITHHRSAFTLLEVVIAIAILSTVMGVAAQSMLTGTQMSQSMDSSMAADSTSRRVVANLISEMRSATNNNMTNFALDADSITFDVCTGIDMATGNPIFGDTRSFIYDAVAGTLVKKHNYGAADEYTELLASNLPPDAFNIVVGSDDDAYTVSLTTEFSDAEGNVSTRTTTGSVFLREGLVSPEAAIASAGTTSGGTNSGDSTAGGTQTDGGTVIVPNIPTVTITMTRSASGKDVTGTVVAEVPSSDSISAFTVTVSAGTWSANTDSSSSTYKQVKRVQISGVRGIDVTVSCSASSATGGSKSASRTVAQ